MCGIAGIVDSRRKVDPGEIKGMADSIAHRGPDAEGFFFANGRLSKWCGPFEEPGFDPRCALGHRRLSIIDLEGGAQPMSNEDGTVWITFNGEIYNHSELRIVLKKAGHVFRSDHSDTEVIIHAYEQWGIQAFDLLNGIFAFGLLDLKHRKLILARDHFGVKPLYYNSHDGRIVFSSEIKAILATRDIERDLDLTALNNYLSFRYVPSPLTAFRDIFKIEAGGYLAYDMDANEILTGSYASRETIVDYGKSFPQWVEEYRQLFEQAVQRQLLSDVEVGALLSGGIDSSAVCAVAVRHLGHALRTYTVGFKDFDEGNELDEASAFAKYLGTVHRNIVIDTTDFIKVLDEVAWFMDEPTATSSAIPLYYLTREIRKDVKVVLTGQGADEPLAGYPRYRGERLYQSGFKHLGFLQSLVEKLPRQEPLKRAFRSFQQHDAFERFLSVYWLFNPSQKQALLKEPLPWNGALTLRKLFELYTADDSLGRMLYMDARAWLPDDLLTYGDKATMINAIEARVPILDKELIAFIETMPSKYKLSLSLQGKLVHRKACEKWLPSFVLRRSKKGFATPIDKWFRNEMGGYVRDQLLGGKVCRGLFNEKAIETMIASHRVGRENFQRHLFALLMLEKWACKFNISV